MKFKKFTEIENHYHKSINNYLDFKDETWVALNKVDGSNFSMWYNGEYFHLAKRSSFIHMDSSFGNQLEVTPKYFDEVKKLYNLLNDSKEISLDDFGIAVFGEIFGGYYNHQDVERNKFAKKIQGRVNYYPNNDFIVFDVLVFNEEQDIYYWLDYETVKYYISQTNLKMTQEIARGSLQDMLNLDVVFQDPTYKLYDLPEIEENLSEGVVCKPIKELKDKFGSRVIFKKKNENFSEKSKKERVKKPKELTNEDINNIDLLDSLINDNRLLSVLSKDFTEPTFKDFGKIMQLFSEDVIKDFEKESEIMFKDLSDVVRKRLGGRCAEVLREYLKRNC